MALIILNKTLDEATLTGGAEILASGGGLPRRITSYRRTWVNASGGTLGNFGVASNKLIACPILWHPTSEKFFVMWIDINANTRVKRIDLATLSVDMIPTDGTTLTKTTGARHMFMHQGELCLHNYHTVGNNGGLAIFDPDDLDSYRHIACPLDYPQWSVPAPDGTIYFGYTNGDWYKHNFSTGIGDGGNPISGPTMSAGMGILDSDGTGMLLVGQSIAGYTGASASGTPVVAINANLIDGEPMFSAGIEPQPYAVAAAHFNPHASVGEEWTYVVSSQGGTTYNSQLQRAKITSQVATKHIHLGNVPWLGLGGWTVHSIGIGVSPTYAGDKKYIAWTVTGRGHPDKTGYLQADIRRRTIQRASWAWTVASGTYPGGLTIKSVDMPGDLPLDDVGYDALASDVVEADYADLVTCTCYWSIDGGSRTEFNPGTPMTVVVDADSVFTVDVDMFDWTPVSEQPWVAGTAGEGPTVVADDPAATVYTDRWLNSQKSTVGSTNTPNGRARIIL